MYSASVRDITHTRHHPFCFNCDLPHQRFATTALSRGIYCPHGFFFQSFDFSPKKSSAPCGHVKLGSFSNWQTSNYVLKTDHNASRGREELKDHAIKQNATLLLGALINNLWTMVTVD